MGVMPSCESLLFAGQKLLRQNPFGKKLLWLGHTIHTCVVHLPTYRSIGWKDKNY